MKHVTATATRAAFAILTASRQVQAVRMTLRAGESSDDKPSNEHRYAEQWMFVVAGSGEATIGKSRRSLRRINIRRHSLLLIEKGELHKIKNTGRQALVTVNFYCPPAYDSDGEPLT